MNNLGRLPFRVRPKDEPAMSKTIEDLPPETIMEVVKHISMSVSWKSSLYNLCLIKVFNPAAIQMLYKDCLDYDSKEICAQRPNERTYLLFRTLFKTRRLAAHVRSFALLPDCSCGDISKSRNGLASPIESDSSNDSKRSNISMLSNDSNVGLWEANPKYVRFLCSVAESIYVKDAADKRRWIERIESEKCEGAIVALLLLYLPNITNLYLDGKCKWDPFNEAASSRIRYWEVAFPSRRPSFSFKSPPTYHCLRDVTLMMDHGVDMTHIASFMKLPAIQRLFVFGFSESSDRSLWNWSPDLFPYASSNLKTLILCVTHGGKVVHHDVLSLLIRSCKALQAFAYNSYSEPLPLDNSDLPETDFAVVGAALRQHQHTLQKLSLVATGGTTKWSHTTSFADFDMLEDLVIDAGVLLRNHDGSDLELMQRLPPSVERLYIYNVCSWLFHALGYRNGIMGNLLGTCSSDPQFPDLEYLRLGIDRLQNLDNKMKQKLKARGVKLDYQTSGLAEGIFWDWGYIES